MSIQNAVCLICDRKSRDIYMSLHFSLSCLAHSNEGFSFPCCSSFFGEGQFWDLWQFQQIRGFLSLHLVVLLLTSLWEVLGCFKVFTSASIPTNCLINSFSGFSWGLLVVTAMVSRSQLSSLWTNEIPSGFSGLRYDSISNVRRTASSIVFGLDCFTPKATCGLVSCVRYWFKANRSLASSCNSGYALSASFSRLSPYTSQFSFLHFVRVLSSAMYSSFLLSGSNCYRNSALACLKSPQTCSCNLLKAVPALPKSRTRIHLRLAASSHSQTVAMLSKWSFQLFSPV